MPGKLDTDSFFDSDDQSSSHLKVTSDYSYSDKKLITGQGTNLVNNPPSSRSTSGHFSGKTDDDKMSRRSSLDGSPGDKSARSYTVYSRQSRSPTNSYQYSDSFDSEDSGQDTRHATPASRRQRKKDLSAASRRAPKKSTKSFSSASTNAGRNTTKKTKGPRKGTGTQSVGNSSSRTMSMASVQQSPRLANEVAQRMLSAKGHTISRLRNELEEIRLKYDDTLSENKLLKQVQRRQERALTKFQSDEAELPQLLKKHSAELDSLNRRIRKYQEKDKDKERRLKEQHEQLLKTRAELTKLQDLAADKGLKERDQLRKRVDMLEDELEEKNERLKGLEKYVENMKKNHRRTEHEWRVKELDIKKRFRDTEMERDELRYRLKEKEKELDIRNIYSHRIAKAPSRLRTLSESDPVHSSLAHSLSTDTQSPRSESKPSPRHVAKPRRTSSFSKVEEKAMTERKEVLESGKLDKEEKFPYEPEVSSDSLEVSSKRKEKDKFAEEEKALENEEERKEEVVVTKESPRRETTFEKEKEEKVVDEKEDEHLKILRMLDADVQSLETKKATEKSSQGSSKQENKGKVFGNTDNSAYKPTWLFGKQDEKKGMSRENEKKKEQLIEDLKSPKESPKKEEEKPFPFFGSTKPKETSTQETKPAPSSVVNSVRDLHKYSNSAKSDKPGVTQKDGITFNTSWKEESGTSNGNTSTQNDDYQKKKELLLKKMKEIDDGDNLDRAESGKSQKEYKFTQPVENLHHGKPSHPEINLSPKDTRKNQGNFFGSNSRRKSKDEIDVEEISFGSYAPSFSKPKETKQDKKPATGLFDDSKDGVIFNKELHLKQTSNTNSFNAGSDSTDRNTKSSFGGENVFSTSTKAKPVADSNGLPWEANSRSSQSRTAFNGGSKQSSLFATTTYNQQKSPFAAKPITTAASDDIDDDIEEFIL